jgi:AbrB family looped-hinge helix DNA binding protein
MTVRVRDKGAVTLPAALRTRYGLQAGDRLSVLDLDGLLLLAPRKSHVEEMAAKIEALREEVGLSESDLLAGLEEQHERYYREKQRGNSSEDYPSS